MRTARRLPKEDVRSLQFYTLIVVAFLLGLVMLTGCGKNGAPGAPGISVAESMTCRSSSMPFGSTEMQFTYQFITYSTGDVQAICSVTNNGMESSNTVYTRETAPDVGSGVCLVPMSDGALNGTWFFAGLSKLRISFQEDGGPNDGAVITGINCYSDN